jgi:hypothetical protein
LGKPGAGATAASLAHSQVQHDELRRVVGEEAEGKGMGGSLLASPPKFQSNGSSPSVPGSQYGAAKAVSSGNSGSSASSSGSSSGSAGQRRLLPPVVVHIEDYMFAQLEVDVQVGQWIEFRLSKNVPAHAEHELCGTSAAAALCFDGPLMQVEQLYYLSLCDLCGFYVVVLLRFVAYWFRCVFFFFYVPARVFGTAARRVFFVHVLPRNERRDLRRVQGVPGDAVHGAGARTHTAGLYLAERQPSWRQ